MMESESSESSGPSSNQTLGRRMQGWCALLLAAGMLVTMATWSTPVAVTSLSERGLPESAGRIALAANRTSSLVSLSSSSSSSSSSAPLRFEAARRHPHSPSGSRHSKKTGGHHGHGRTTATDANSNSNANANASRAVTETANDPNDAGSREDGSHEDGAQGIHLLLRPPELLAPSQGPLLHGNEPTPATPTLAPPDDTESSPTAEDWGSGDYLETLTFMGADAEDLSLLSSLPTLTHSLTHTHTHEQELDEGGTGVSYDTAFPARPTLPLSSRTLPPTIIPGDPRLPPGAGLDEELDFDWAEMYPIEPTEMLLPDMNSLEYYNMLQNRENATRTHTSHTHVHTHTHTHSKESKDNTSPGQEHRDSKDTPLISPTPTHTYTHMHTHTHTHAPPPAPTPAKPSISSTPSLSPPILRAPPTDTHRPSPPKPTPHATMGIARPPGPPAIPPPAPTLPRKPTTQAITIKPPRIPSVPRPSTTPSTRAPLPTTPRIPLPPPSRQPLCNISRPEMYQVQVGMPVGTSVAFAKAHIKDVLRREFNRSVELQVVKAPPNFMFRTVAGPLVFTAVSVINALRQATRSSASSTILSVTFNAVTVPDHKHLVHSVLQFVPGHVDVRVCTFSEQVERGLLTAYGEVRRRYQENGSFTIEIVNITISMAKAQRQQQRAPVDITFAVRDERGYLLGSEVSAHLRQLSMVEYSFYLGFPAVQIAEPFHYPELNMTHLLRSSWVKTVLLGVLDQRVSERTFQAKMERRLAQLVGEGLGVSRRWRRATTVGNNSVQVVRAVRLEGADHPLELVYFLEGSTGERLPAHTTAALLNRINLQRAAIVLGYRVHGTVLAQPVEKLALSPSETQPSSVWLVVGVVVPVLVVLFIIVILYWKLCRSEKLEFQPDAMSTITQRQKLQAPSVKGFDFAKLHLGQHSKDDIMVIQEPAPMPPQVKEATPSEGGELNTPKSKSSSTKVSRSGAGRRRGRLSPSDGDSLGSEASSGRDSAEESTRPAATPNEGKQHRKSKHSKSKLAAGGSGADEQLSSSSIFDHVDRMSRGSSDGTRRVSNKIQLIAMQPVPSPPTPQSHLPPHHEHAHAHTHTHTYTLTERGPDGTQVNTEIAVALRHKSEIEHHRNKIRLRAKRKGLYEFPSMEDIMAAFGDSAEQQRVCQQIHKILHPDSHSSHHSHTPSAEGHRRSSRGRRSPRQRHGQPVIGSLDKDRLITDRDATYRKYPGVNNVAYVSDPEHLAAGSPSPDDVFAPGSPPSGPAPAPPSYQPPQPTIEEARQQMLSLLDDAFALVSPSSQGSPAPLALTSVAGVTAGGAVSPGAPTSPPPRPIRHWGSAPSHSPFSARYAELGMSPTSVQGLLQREALGSSYLPSDVYSSRGQYGDEPSCSHRPRPVGGSTGAQLQQLTQVGLSSRMGVYGVGRSVSGPSGCSWLQYRSDDEEPRPGSDRDNILSYSAEYSSSPLFQMPRTALTDPSAPPTPTYSPPAPPEGPPPDPPPQSSASLIKAIREELQRLSQKQPPLATYHS